MSSGQSSDFRGRLIFTDVKARASNSQSYSNKVGDFKLVFVQRT
jgi:hypothetical protein